MPGTKRPFSDSNATNPDLQAPPFDDLDAVAVHLLNENLSAFFQTWIPYTLLLFARTGAAVHSRFFWASQMRTDLDHVLWRLRYLGREATAEEVDWLVEAAMGFQWPRVEKMLEGRSSEKRRRSWEGDEDEEGGWVGEYDGAGRGV
jgi:uncharacterized protein (DUF2126 family)